jgi:hypothetical protein
MRWLMPVIPATQEMEIGGFQSQAGPDVTSCLKKITKAKRAGGMAQEVECLHSKCKPLSSNPSTAKKKN